MATVVTAGSRVLQTLHRDMEREKDPEAVGRTALGSRNLQEQGPRVSPFLKATWVSWVESWRR